MVWCLCCTILLHKLCQSYVFPASDLCRDVPIFLWVLLMLKGMRLVFFSVCVCVLMITKRVSFHFHHGKRQVWDVSMLNVADSAHLRPWMQAWILHVVPSRLPVACFFLRDACHICRVWWWGGGCQLIRNGHWIYGAEFICMKLKALWKTISISSHSFTCFELHSYQPTQTCFIPKLSRQYFNPFWNCFGFQRFQQQVMPWWSLFNSPVVCTALCCANYPLTHDFGMVAWSFMWLGTKIDQKTCRPGKSNGRWPSVVKSS